MDQSDDLDGYPPGSLGYELRRIRLEAERIGADEILDQLDAFESRDAERRRERLFRYFAS